MNRRRLAQIDPASYNSSGIQSRFDPTIFTEGSKNILITGQNKPTAFKGVAVQGGKVGARIMTQAGESYAGLGRFADGANPKGSVVRVMAGLFFAGTGRLMYDGSDMSVDASSILQLRLLASGVFTGSTYQAGLSQPSAPTIATRTSLGGGMSGKLKAGTYTVKIYKIRSATGARSLASPASNFATAVESNNIGQSLRVTFPSIGSNGEDRWGICVTPRNFGSTGPYFLYKEVAESALSTIDSVARSYEIEWADGDLEGQPLAPNQSYAPPSCIFAGAIGNSVFVDGCYGDTVSGTSASAPGTVIACSLPLRPEEFPLDWLAFPPDAPTALLRGGDGYYYRMGKNSVGVISYIGGTGDAPPIAYQLMWGTTGCSYPHNAVVAEGGRLYIKSGTKGLVRIGDDGQPESLWASAFIDDVESWLDEDTVLGWDENYGNVCIMNNLTVIPYNTRLEKCGSPIDLTGLVTGKILGAVTHVGALYIACLDTPNSTVKIYKFNSGTGSVVQMYSDWFFSQGHADYIREIEIRGRFDSVNPITLKVFKNESLAAPVINTTITPVAGAPVRIPLFRGLIPDMRSWCIYLSQQSAGGDMGFETIDVSGYSKSISK
jgi:hypothetical protein